MEWADGIARWDGQMEWADGVISMGGGDFTGVGDRRLAPWASRTNKEARKKRQVQVRRAKKEKAGEERRGNTKEDSRKGKRYGLP